MTGSEIFSGLFAAAMVLLTLGIRDFFARRNVSTTEDQAKAELVTVDADRDKLITQMATQQLAMQGVMLELVRDKAASGEREKNYTELNKTLSLKLAVVEKTLSLAYGEVTRLNGQIEKLLVSIADGTKLGPVIAAQEVRAEQEAPKEAVPVTQDVIDQVATATPPATPEAEAKP